MFQSDDLDEDFFNDILESDSFTNIQNQNAFVFNPVISKPNNNNGDFQFCEPSTSKSENIIKLFTKPKNNSNNNSGVFSRKNSPNRHRKVVQRKFPGPAGLLPENKIDINLKNLEQSDISINKTIASDEIICSQISVNCFKENPWIDMCKDFYLQNEKLYLNEKYSIFWTKTKAMSKQLLGQKTPFLAAIIKHIDYTTKNPMITLKDPTGEMSGTLHHEVWEEFSEKLNVGSIIVLHHVGVLITLKKCYLNITPKNIITIYHYKEPHPLTQNTSTQRRFSEITRIKNLSAQEMQNSIMEYRKNFTQEKQNSLTYQDENENPFFKQNSSLCTSLFSPYTSSRITNVSKNMQQSSLKMPQINHNQNASLNSTQNKMFHVTDKSSQSNTTPVYRNQTNLMQRGPTNHQNLNKKTVFPVNQKPDGIKLDKKGSQLPQNAIKRPKLAQNDPFSEEDIIPETPEFINRTNFLIQNKINHQDIVKRNFTEERSSFSNHIVSETLGFIDNQPNLKHFDSKYKLQDARNKFCNDDLNFNIISETPEVIENVAHVSNLGTSCNSNLCVSTKKVSDGSSSSNFKFVNKINKNNCDNAKIDNNKNTNRNIGSSKNIFFNDNFVDGLEDSFLEDF